MIWLGEGILGDDTDGHIDDIARFVSPDTVVCAYEEDPAEANHLALKDAHERLRRAKDHRKKALNVLTLPMPGPVLRKDGSRLPASYANFYIANGTVLVPVFGHPNDATALQILQKLFPTRRVQGIHCAALVHGLGTLHCITQQQPAL